MQQFGLDIDRDFGFSVARQTNGDAIAMPSPSESIDRVRQTWSVVAALPDLMAGAFYNQLFRIDPTTEPLFRGDLELQGRKLVETLSFVVDHLHDDETISAAAKELAIRHLKYGVEPQHYASVGKALLGALKQLLGDRFGSEDEAAWRAIYAKLSGTMVTAAYPAKS